MLATVRTRDGIEITHTYDAANRLEAITPSAIASTTLRYAGRAHVRSRCIEEGG